jgi:hypothetical protein
LTKTYIKNQVRRGTCRNGEVRSVGKGELDQC